MRDCQPSPVSVSYTHLDVYKRQALRREPGLAEPCGELAAREHVEQLSQQHLARAKLELSGLGAIDQPARQPGGDQARDKQIRVEDEMCIRDSSWSLSGIAPKS